jgi:hypothetical protein
MCEMANIIDYLRWRGDLDFSISPFNEIDAAIFATFSYVNVAGIVPGWDLASGISMPDALDRIFMKFYPSGEKPKSNSEIVPTLSAKFNTDLEDMLRALPACPRYNGVCVSGFEENVDVIAGRQFAAVVFTLPVANPHYVVAFRGTDNTLVGWEEDFRFAYMEQVPAQDSAQRYLERALDRLTGPVAVCGHSKGGNLAVYAGVHANACYQDQISKIFNFDGPGFCFNVIDPAPFAACRDKIVNFVPEESMIGMLFDSVGERTVVSSLSHSAGQHNAFFWNAGPTGFVRGNLADAARMLDRILKSWMSDLALSERQAFLEAIFDLLGDVDETVISKDPLKNLADVRHILKKYKQLDPETRSFINQVLATLSTETRRTLSTTIQKKLRE